MPTGVRLWLSWHMNLFVMNDSAISIEVLDTFSSRMLRWSC